MVYFGIILGDVPGNVPLVNSYYGFMSIAAGIIFIFVFRKKIAFRKVANIICLTDIRVRCGMG